MNDLNFSLQQFPTTTPLPDLRITGNIVRHVNKLAVRYLLLGPMAELSIPEQANTPARKDKLWEETCLEFFLNTRDSDQYWEFNLSPAGHWNVFRFNSYRQGMQEELAYTSLPFIVKKKPDALHLSLEFDLSKIIPAGRPMRVAISAVIKSLEGKVSSWALTHPSSQADFHHRESFVIELS
jgi:hypothetical protein